jgi:hypothetical protein
MNENYNEQNDLLPDDETVKKWLGMANATSNIKKLHIDKGIFGLHDDLTELYERIKENYIKICAIAHHYNLCDSYDMMSPLIDKSIYNNFMIDIGKLTDIPEEVTDTQKTDYFNAYAVMLQEVTDARNQTTIDFDAYTTFFKQTPELEPLPIYRLCEFVMSEISRFMKETAGNIDKREAV